MIVQLIVNGIITSSAYILIAIGLINYEFMSGSVLGGYNS